MTDKELIKLARFNHYPEEQMDLLVGWGRRVLMAQRQFDLELMADNIRAAVMKEREACAKVVEQEIDRVKPLYSVVAENAAKAIRARGEP
jgi:hypothetical protein